MCWLVCFVICQLLLGYLILKFSFFVCVLVGWFYDMSTLVRIFNIKVFCFLFVCWLVGFMIWQFLLGYLIPKSPFFVFVLAGWFHDMSTLVRIFNTKVFCFSVCVLVGRFYDMSILVRIFNTKVFFFLFVCWLVGWLVGSFMICQLLLGYLIPRFSLFCLFVCWLVVWLVGWLIGWFYMSTLVRIFNTKVFSFCLCVGWLVL